MATTHGVSAPALATPRWYAHGWNTPAVYRLGSTLATRLPRRVRLRLASTLGSRAAAFFPAERRAIRSSISRFRPHASSREREALVRDVFRHFAICFADLITTNRSDDTSSLLAAVHGERDVHEALERGRGLIVLTAHVGNWELAGRLLAGRLTRPTHVVVEPEANPKIEEFLRGNTASIRFVSRARPTAVLQVISALRRGEIVAMQGDRALGGRSDARIPFFGSEASFPIGPFVLARASGAPIVPAFCVCEPDRRYTITIGTAIKVAAGAEHRALAGWVASLEQIVARHPEQWFNFFDVWSRHPER